MLIYMFTQQTLTSLCGYCASSLESPPATRSTVNTMATKRLDEHTLPPEEATLVVGANSNVSAGAAATAPADPLAHFIDSPTLEEAVENVKSKPQLCFVTQVSCFGSRVQQVSTGKLGLVRTVVEIEDDKVGLRSPAFAPPTVVLQAEKRKVEVILDGAIDGGKLRVGQVAQSTLEDLVPVPAIFVRFSRLVGAQHLNGRVGILQSVAPNDAGRWAVIINLNGEAKLLKPENLVVPCDQASASALWIAEVLCWEQSMGVTGNHPRMFQMLTPAYAACDTAAACTTVTDLKQVLGQSEHLCAIMQEYSTLLHHFAVAHTSIRAHMLEYIVDRWSFGLRTVIYDKVGSSSMVDPQMQRTFQETKRGIPGALAATRAELESAAANENEKVPCMGVAIYAAMATHTRNDDGLERLRDCLDSIVAQVVPPDAVVIAWSAGKKYLDRTVAELERFEMQSKSGKIFFIPPLDKVGGGGVQAKSQFQHYRAVNHLIQTKLVPADTTATKMMLFSDDDDIWDELRVLYTKLTITNHFASRSGKPASFLFSYCQTNGGHLKYGSITEAVLAGTFMTRLDSVGSGGWKSSDDGKSCEVVSKTVYSTTESYSLENDGERSWEYWAAATPVETFKTFFEIDAEGKFFDDPFCDLAFATYVERNTVLMDCTSDTQCRLQEDSLHTPAHRNRFLCPIMYVHRRTDTGMSNSGRGGGDVSWAIRREIEKMVLMSIGDANGDHFRRRIRQWVRSSCNTSGLSGAPLKTELTSVLKSMVKPDHTYHNVLDRMVF